ncbi:MAG: catalase [Solirubrobacterales bacterium]
MSEKPRTDQHGTPAPNNSHSETLGERGPILMGDRYLFEKMQNFNRERVPERVVHAKGSGAHGYFEATEDVSKWCRADFLQQGKKTDVFARFSTVAGEQGSPDTWRDPRGFALKFYTQQGNYDMVGNNTPVFFVRDPLKFSDFIHSQKRNTQTGLRDHTWMWDFWSLSPESLHQVVWLLADRGIPKSFRHMNGYSSHTYRWVNEAGEASWVKYHFKTDQGIEWLSDEKAGELAGFHPDYHRHDLFDAIDRGDHPSWTLKVQVMPEAEAADYRFNPFDLTKVWPHSDYPTHEVGKLVLNRNPENFFAETEQSAFEPGNMVPGIEPSPDKMLQNRLISYADTHRHRIGSNYPRLPINCPIHESNDPHNRDGHLRADGNHGGRPNYQPNSFDDPPADGSFDESPVEYSGATGRYDYDAHPEDSDSVQATMFWEMIGSDAQDRLVDNVAGHLGNVTDEGVRKRSLDYLRMASDELADRVAEGIGASEPVAGE